MNLLNGIRAKQITPIKSKIMYDFCALTFFHFSIDLIKPIDKITKEACSKINEQKIMQLILFSLNSWVIWSVTDEFLTALSVKCWIKNNKVVKQQIPKIIKYNFVFFVVNVILVISWYIIIENQKNNTEWNNKSPMYPNQNDSESPNISTSYNSVVYKTSGILK